MTPTAIRTKGVEVPSRLQAYFGPESPEILRLVRKIARRHYPRPKMKQRGFNRRMIGWVAWTAQLPRAEVKAALFTKEQPCQQ